MVRNQPHSVSLEQVADLFGVTLTPFQRLVAANDVGYIPGIERELLLQGIAPASAEGRGMIDLVRRADRCAQGVTPDDEAQAVRDVEAAEWRGRKVLVRVSTNLATALSDLLYGRAEEQIHLNRVTGKWIYFGPRHLGLVALGFAEQHWAGGASDNGYFGIVNPGPESQERILSFFWGE